MKKMIPNLFSICTLSLLLVACGGGSSDNVSSSGTGSTTTGGTTTGGTTTGGTTTGGTTTGGTTTNSNQTISVSCSTPDSGKTYLVTTDGCLIKTSTNTQSAVCTNSTTIKMLTGTSLTKDAVITQGSSFSGGGNLSLNGVIYKCV